MSRKQVSCRAALAADAVRAWPEVEQLDDGTRPHADHHPRRGEPAAPAACREDPDVRDIEVQPRRARRSVHRDSRTGQETLHEHDSLPAHEHVASRGPPTSATCASSSSRCCARRRSPCRRWCSRSCSICCSACLLGSMRGKRRPGVDTFARLWACSARWGRACSASRVSLAFEREHGLLTFKQALPMPPGAYLLRAHGHGDAVRGHHRAAAHRAGGDRRQDVRSTSRQAARIFVIEVLGVLPFCAHRHVHRCVGVRPGLARHRQPDLSTDGVPVRTVGAAAVPAEGDPGRVAPAWPSYHLRQLALGALGAPSTGGFARPRRRARGHHDRVLRDRGAPASQAAA